MPAPGYGEICAMKRESIIFPKIVICLIAVAALAVCLGLPAMIGPEAAKQRPGTTYVPYLFLLYAYTLSVPFFVALFQAFKLLTYIERNKAFSELSVRALRRIKMSAVAIGALMVAGIAGLMVLAAGKGEDIAGIVAPGLLITFVSGVVAWIAAVFQKRVRRAMERTGNI